ncbi:MAG: endolytic transglycosylase MltG [Bacteroidales bacterium]
MLSRSGKEYYSKPRSRYKRLILWSLMSTLGIALMVLFFLVKALLLPNVRVKEGETTFINIRTGSSYDDLKAALYEKDLIRDRGTFEWVARRQGLDKRVKPGRYRLRDGMSNLQLVRMLMGGHQEPVRLVFNSIRTKEQLAGRIAAQIEADSVELLQLLNDSVFLKKWGVRPETAFALFIPNTYEVWWNTSASAFIERMAHEANKFWNEARLQKAKQTGLSRIQVVTLASIIEQETNKNDEKARIAGVYINRLRSGWPLQADPTLKFAHGDWSIKRIRKVHTEIDSPYNTYKFPGLPPGPICVPSIASIDAVLNYEKNDYYYFCAREDMSGYHVFSSTYQQHQQNAERYRRALNRLGIN